MTSNNTNPDLLALHKVINNGDTDVCLQVNPLAKHLNIHLVSASKGKVCMTADINDTYMQGNGVIQGGALAILLDFGLAFAGLSVVSLQQNVSTTNMNISFMRSALPGQYQIVAEIEKLGRTMIFARAQLFDSNEKLVASASSSLVIVQS